MKEVSNCDSCVNFVYDEDDECYVCDMNLDEDDMVRFLTGTFDNCPYYQLDNEYLVVRHQMQACGLHTLTFCVIFDTLSANCEGNKWFRHSSENKRTGDFENQ